MLASSLSRDPANSTLDLRGDGFSVHASLYTGSNAKLQLLIALEAPQETEAAGFRAMVGEVADSLLQDAAIE